MYLHNKYTTWYYSIINRAKTRQITESFERHHIIPKSLGGNNRKDNLVKLTFKEHRLCHLLLPRMLTGTARNKMLFAAKRMVDKCAKIHGMSRGESYARLRQQVKELVSQLNQGRPACNRGSTHTPETLEKLQGNNQGSAWFTNGIDEIKGYGSLPDGWWRGRKPSSVIHNPNPKGCVGNSRGKKRYTNGKEEILIDGACPDGFWPGRKQSFINKSSQTKKENGTLNPSSPESIQKRLQTLMDRYGTTDMTKIIQLRRA